MATTVRLSPDVEKRLNFLAAQTGRSKAYYLRELIERHLEDLEDYYLAAAVLERVRKGEEEVMSAEDFWRGVDD
ncbi:MAG: ribbon-helix-helix protein, CopG family [Candidatus Tectomicrobia bacterium]|nr:ribbon-helix-helix protein, CopG family [Candidatus Tectomicrobia bacterium]